MRKTLFNPTEEDTIMLTLARKTLHRTLAALAAAILAVPAGAAEENRFQGVTLRVATWGGQWRDMLRDHVAKEVERRGGKVEYVIGSPTENFAKLAAARGQVPFDVMEILGTNLHELLGRNLLAKLRLKDIPNTRNIAPDQVTDHAVATWFTEELIMYNRPKLQELGIAPPESLADLRNPKLAGRVMIPDISSGGGIEALGAFAFAAGGNEQNIAPGLKLISEIPGVRFWKTGGEVVTQLKSGDVWVAVAHGGWAVRAANAGIPVATVLPKIGSKRGTMKEGYVGVIRGSRHQDAAEFFINAYLDNEVQFQLAQKLGTVPTNPDARARLVGLPVIKDLIELDSTRIGNMLRLDPAKIDLTSWLDQWNKSVAR